MAALCASGSMGDTIIVAGGRVVELNLSGLNDGYLRGNLPSEIGLLTGLRKLNFFNTPSLTGCIPSNLSGIDYVGELPFFGASSYKKVLSPTGMGLVG